MCRSEVLLAGNQCEVCQDSGEGDAFCDGGSASNGDYGLTVFREAAPSSSGAVPSVYGRYFGLRWAAYRNKSVGGLVQRSAMVQ